jgi:hypothetical protein
LTLSWFLFCSIYFDVKNALQVTNIIVKGSKMIYEVDRIADLQNELNDLGQMFSGSVDPVIDPENYTPVLMQEAVG